jgi:SRSO17 transposase
VGTEKPSGYRDWLKYVYDFVSWNFSRAEPRKRAWTYLCRLTDVTQDSPAGRSHLAAYAREQRADGAQRLLAMAQWDEDRVRDETRDLALSHFGLAGGTLFVTEAAFVKKGSQAAAVDRQFSADNQRQENCQIAVLLFYQTMEDGLILLDIELYVPMSWLRDPDRCRKACIPEKVGYRSKSQIALDMIDKAMAAGLSPHGVSFSLICRDVPILRQGLGSRRLPPQLDQHHLEHRWRAIREEIRFDRYEVRSWRGWRRHMTLVMIAQIAMELSRIKPALSHRSPLKLRCQSSRVS